MSRNASEVDPLRKCGNTSLSECTRHQRGQTDSSTSGLQNQVQDRLVVAGRHLETVKAVSFCLRFLLRGLPA